MAKEPQFVRTTVLAVRHGGHVVLASDGQVTLDKSVVKDKARKVRRLGNGNVLAGFAGGAADAFALLTRFEEMLSAHSGKLERAAVELVKAWRTDRALRQLQAMLVVADKEKTLLLSGTGDLIEPDDGILGIGSGSVPAMAAARALVTHTSLSAREIVEASLNIAAGIDIYTNNNLTIEEI
ncbi:MAG: ATP-dependent protease subunit HslV [Acidobacteria bacterium]|uniref:ATP-dependent protease subunit HslV n=1 Tax=Candidatus Polarisedimenticola svalbardensis TaxID=2886004 RepID=A0A8J6XZA7_9BACT|nr:ATP-dependent protease subunit HslV [Candidatus Polarisedimenticola svalbardensis]